MRELTVNEIEKVNGRNAIGNLNLSSIMTAPKLKDTGVYFARPVPKVLAVK